MNLKRIGKYEIKGEIGRGTMGTVFRAWDPDLKRYVAIKTMPATPGHNDESKKRFQLEAQAAALLAHPNIVTVHDLGEEQGLVFMAMELLEGHDLRDVISEDAAGRQVHTLYEKLGVMEQVAAGLAFAHSKGVVHRDLKPANIHIQPDGHVKIVDFGLARLPSSDMTQDGIVLGTPNYMSPEQALGDKVDVRTDVFSAGGVFYELLTDKKPFDAETTPGVLYQVVHKDPVPIAKWLPDLPRIVAEVVQRCLAKDRKLRFQNGRQLRAALGVVRQALEAGRGDASLAEESQRAREDSRKSDSSHRGGLSPAESKPPWINGTAALDPAHISERRPVGLSRSAPTLSGRAPTHSGRPPRGGETARRAIPSALGVLLLVALGVGYWYLSTSRHEGPPPPTPSPTDVSREQMGALTEALADSQIELAEKNLDDKNWSEAIAQAERALKLRPASGRAKQILEQAKGKSAELDAQAARARRAYEAGNEQEASQALGRVLELDPNHPVATELNAKLNTAFRSRAQEAKGLSQRARAEAETANAADQDGFAQAVALAADGEAHFKRSEFAGATQRYMEARDSFDRARRSALAARPVPGPATAGAAADDRAPTGPGGPPAPTASSPHPAATNQAAPLPQRTFVTGQSVVASGRSAGGLTGFDSASVKTQKVPDLVGRLEFEVEPLAPRAGEELTIRVYLVNEGKKAVHLRTVALSVTADGRRSSLASTPRDHDVTAQMRALVAEARVTGPTNASSWSLEAVASSDRDETCTSRLTWQ